MGQKNMIINNELQLYKGLTFEEFKKNSLFDNQVDNRFFWLKKKGEINYLNHRFSVGLWFESGVLRQVQLVCIDEEIQDEEEREVIHNNIVNEILDKFDIKSEDIQAYYSKREQYSSIFIDYTK